MGIDELIQTLQKFKKKYPNAELMMIGTSLDDAYVTDVFFVPHNNYDGEPAIIISDGTLLEEDHT